MSYQISTILGIVVFLTIPVLFIASVIRNMKREKKSGIAEKKNK